MSPTDEDALREALEEDPILRDFAATDGPGPFARTSIAGGWRIEPGMLPLALIGSSAREVMGRALSIAEPDDFLAAVDDHLQRFRRLLTGEVDRALVVIPFEGFTLEDQARVDLPWGSLRPAQPYERNNQPFGRVETDAVMERWIPLRMVVGEPEGQPSIEDHDSRQAAEADASRLVLALLLAFYRGGGSPIADEKWRMTIIPGQRAMHFQGRGLFTKAMPRSDPPVLKAADEETLRQWAELVEAHDHTSIRVAVRRVITAIHERSSAEDVLIDSITAWENLFGHGGTTEVKFRVTSALALLLADDLATRESVRRELGKIYDLRSRVVHGGEIGGRRELGEARNRSLEVAIEALRVLFERHRELIPDPSRGLRLILGATSIQTEISSPGSQ